MWAATRPALSVAFLFFIATVHAFCVNLSMPSQIAGPGGSILLTISIVGQGEQVSGLQFDLAFDNSTLSFSLVVGDALRASGKSLYAVNLQAGVTRILITELNQNVIVDGDLVKLFVDISSNAPPGSYPIHFQSAIASDLLGNPLAITTTDGTVTVTSSSGSPITGEGVLNGASLLPGPIAPGEIITILGSFMGITTSAESTSVNIGGFAAPLLYSAFNQINAVVPFEVDGASSTTLEIAGSLGSNAPIPVAVASVAPAIFTLKASGTGQAAVLNQDSSVNSPDNPAPRGSIIALWATGAGQTNPAGTDGQIASSVLPVPRLPVSVLIAGKTTEILYAGAAPSMIAGVIQVNSRVPTDIDPGIAVPVVIRVGDVSSPPVTVAVK